MKSPVKRTHRIIDLSGKLDWFTQRADIPRMKDTIKELRSELTQLQKFIDTNEVIN